MSKGTKMNKKTLAALKASIQHWRENEAAESSDDASAWGEDCALCKLFVIKHDTCMGCPVAKRTSRVNCDGSPWLAARDALREWLRKPDSEQARTAFRTAARAEREFLESLLPEESFKVQNAVSKAMRDLLAVIHRDGGHYAAEHGILKACEDAERIITNERRALQEMTAERDALAEKLERAK